jgi:hypothetical protein
MSRKCGILNVSPRCRPPRPVAGIALLLLNARVDGEVIFRSTIGSESLHKINNNSGLEK